MIVTNINSVLYVNKKRPVGNIDNYEMLSSHEIVFRLKGEVETNLDGSVLNHKCGTIEYLPKGSGKKKYIVETIETGKCIDIFFDTDVPLFDKPTLIDSKYSSELRLLFTEINKIWFKKDTGYYFKALSVLYKILYLIQKDSENGIGQNPYFKKIKSGVEYLNENYCDHNIDYEYVASLCDMSYSYFRRLFLNCMGVSPAKYVVNKKIEYSKELLSSKQYSISEIAGIVGFKDVYYFSHTFKKLTGYAPSKLII